MIELRLKCTESSELEKVTAFAAGLGLKPVKKTRNKGFYVLSTFRSAEKKQENRKDEKNDDTTSRD